MTIFLDNISVSPKKPMRQKSKQNKQTLEELNWTHCCLQAKCQSPHFHCYTVLIATDSKIRDAKKKLGFKSWYMSYIEVKVKSEACDAWLCSHIAGIAEYNI